ncbi:MAG: hypothetical protein JNM56_25330 [Planctomycetia bacterium]|nr:hypothetical protein [Planctomycetia bacterium]
MKPLARLVAWWKRAPASSGSLAAYDLTCPCGQSCQGARQLKHQALRCPRCQRALFVLPLSPLPAVRGGSAAPGNARSMRRVWLAPLLAGGLTFVVVVVLFVACWNSLVPGRASSAAGTRPAGTIEQHVAIGRKALQIGDFNLARDELTSARALVLADPASVSADDRRQLQQLHRQAALLVDWPKDSLEQILLRLAPLRDDEWQAVIGKYCGKVFAFDLEARRDAARQYQVRFTRLAGRLNLRLDPHDLVLFQHLPLDNPQRLWFAARLADVRREAPDRCIIRLDPNDAVLLTDVNPLALGAQVPDAHLVLQRKWTAELP